MKMIWCGLKIKENCNVLVNQLNGNFRSETFCYRKIKSGFRDVKWCFDVLWEFKGLNVFVIFAQPFNPESAAIFYINQETRLFFSIWIHPNGQITNILSHQSHLEVLISIPPGRLIVIVVGQIQCSELPKGLKCSVLSIHQIGAYRE